MLAICSQSQVFRTAGCEDKTVCACSSWRVVVSTIAATGVAGAGTCTVVNCMSIGMASPASKTNTQPAIWTLGFFCRKALKISHTTTDNNSEQIEDSRSSTNITSYLS